MATVVYADGTLATGENDGTSWTDAYRGATGLQAALDAVVDGQDTIIYIRNTFTITSTVDVDTGGGATTSNDWLTIIGCDAAGDELTTGNYVDLDAGDNDLTGPVVEVVDVSNVMFKNIHTKDNHGAAAAADNGFELDHTGTKYGFVLINCKSSGCRSGLESTDNLSRNVVCIDCDFEGNGDHGVNSIGISQLFAGCRFATDSTYAASVGQGTTLVDCRFEGGSYGAGNNNYGVLAAIGCTFYSQSEEAIRGNNANSVVVAYNCICQPDAADDDFFVLVTGSVGYQDYNFLEATDDALLTDNSEVDVTITFADAGGGDFSVLSILDSSANHLGALPGKPDAEGRGTMPGAVSSPRGAAGSVGGFSVGSPITGAF